MSLVPIGILLFSVPARSQTANSDTSYFREAKEQIIRLYMDSLHQNLRIYDGFEFTGAYRRSAGHPFFNFEQPRQGTILYDGTNYPGVMLAYDLTKDEVMVVNPVSNRNISLVTSRVERFELDEHVFIRLRSNEAMTGFPGDGFYEVLYNNDTTTVLAKLKKTMRAPARAEELSKFTQSDVYYVRRGDTFDIIGSKRALLKMTGDYKGEVAKFMQREKLNFKKAPGQAIVKVMEFYDRLKR